MRFPVLLGFSVPLLAVAAAARADDTYLVDVFNPDTNHLIAGQFESDYQSALDSALGFCGSSDCYMVGWVANGCLAIVADPANKLYPGWDNFNQGTTLVDVQFSAENYAYQACEQAGYSGGQCNLLASKCTPGR
jgi:hypothetical protein